MQKPISITGIASVSALGTSSDEVWESYLSAKPLFTKKKLGDEKVWVSELASNAELKELQQTEKYKKLDRSVLMAILAAKKPFSVKSFSDKNIGVNIGSSRGATGLFENYHKQFLNKKSVSAYSSPTTTLGNISSWVGQELGVEGVQMGHSVTCSTSMHAVLNGIAWLQADMADAFVVGGSEAPLTPFTIAQMQALKIYSRSENEMACESLSLRKTKNTMVLGEAAAVAVLEKGIAKNALAVISGFGYATEKLEHNISISENADCFQKSMKMSLQKAGLKNVDCIVMHAPGTVKGDIAEWNAIKSVFGENLPLLTTNKWQVGHTFGASGMLSIELALLMLNNNKFIENPFYNEQGKIPKELKTVMINAVGFGGNAVSIIITKP